MYRPCGKQRRKSKCFIIVFCVVVFKTINCATEDHGLQMYNGTSSHLRHHLLKYKREYDNGDYSERLVDDGGEVDKGGVADDTDVADEEDETVEESEVDHGSDEVESLEEQDVREYARHGNSHRHSHGRQRNRYIRHGKKQKTEMARVTMPSGWKYYITKPNTSKWRCGVKSTRTKLITLNPKGKMGKKEYNMVAQEMQASVPPFMGMNYQIVKIQKVINGCFWRRYRGRQAVIYAEAHILNERMLFHGSKKIRDILKTGFDERLAAISGALGAGIYFSPLSFTGNMFTSARPGVKGQMLLCRVTVGKLYRAPTYPDRHAHAPPGYHSVGGGPPVGDLYNEIVVYRGEQAHPEYLITYKF